MKRAIVVLLTLGIVVFASANADQEISKEAVVEDASQLFIDLVLDKTLGSSKPSSAFEILSTSYDESQLKLFCQQGSPFCAAVSCSSRDRNKDCFCGDQGCWRTQTDCGCLGGGDTEIEPGGSNEN